MKARTIIIEVTAALYDYEWKSVIPVLERETRRLVEAYAALVNDPNVEVRVIQRKRDELLTGLRALQGDEVDPEMGHVEADALLLDYIDDDEVAEAYNGISKWYA